jgi:hypothetical protein
MSSICAKIGNSARSSGPVVPIPNHCKKSVANVSNGSDCGHSLDVDRMVKPTRSGFGSRPRRREEWCEAALEHLFTTLRRASLRMADGRRNLPNGGSA